MIILAFVNTYDHGVSERRNKDRADQKFCKLTVEHASRAILGISLTLSQKCRSHGGGGVVVVPRQN